MRKITALLLALAMTSALCACGSTKEKTIEDYKGSYTDSFSERATLDLVPTSGEDGYTVLIAWGGGSYETDTWTMTVEYTPDGKLLYSDGEHTRFTWQATGETEEEIIAQNQEGYFSIDKKGNLCWDGAADEDCRECVFKKDK